jgi:hypothetical protein
MSSERAHLGHTIGPADASEADVPVRALVGRVGRILHALKAGTLDFSHALGQ